MAGLEESAVVQLGGSDQVVESPAEAGSAATSRRCPGEGVWGTAMMWILLVRWSVRL
jgi:hypothetical protein